MCKPTGFVGDIQLFSVGDGPGIRTTVFLKGCNLHCGWCHNPEEQTGGKTLLFYRARCTGCGGCAERCGRGAVRFADGLRRFDPSRCIRCGGCVDGCPTGALRSVGREMTVDEVMAVLLEDKPFYERSGGGVTLSGGEPLCQPDFCEAIAAACRTQGIPVLIETAACLPTAVFERLLPLADEFYLDLKAADEETYRTQIGGSLALVLQNLRFLTAHGANVTARLPLIPGIADQPDYGSRVGRLLWEAGVTRAELLPFHRLGSGKYEAMGLRYAYRDARPLTAEETARCRDGFPAGIAVSVQR